MFAISVKLRRYRPRILSKMCGKLMTHQIVPPGYAVPKKEIERLTEELRQARAAELAKASEKDRVPHRKRNPRSREVKRKCKGTFHMAWLRRFPRLF